MSDETATPRTRFSWPRPEWEDFKAGLVAVLLDFPPQVARHVVVLVGSDGRGTTIEDPHPTGVWAEISHPGTNPTSPNTPTSFWVQVCVPRQTYAANNIRHWAALLRWRELPAVANPAYADPDPGHRANASKNWGYWVPDWEARALAMDAVDDLAQFLAIALLVQATEVDAIATWVGGEYPLHAHRLTDEEVVACEFVP